MEENKELEIIIALHSKIEALKVKYPSKFDFKNAEEIFYYKKEESESIYKGVLKSAIAGLKLMENGIFVGTKTGGKEIRLYVRIDDFEKAKKILYDN